MEQLNNNNGEQRNFLPRFRVFCPLCSWRLMDKLTPLEGTVQIKCPNCRKVVEINHNADIYAVSAKLDKLAEKLVEKYGFERSM